MCILAVVVVAQVRPLTVQVDQVVVVVVPMAQGSRARNTLVAVVVAVMEEPRAQVAVA
jgi:uncharacterized membrane protein YciS (DUF1049 family)